MTMRFYYKITRAGSCGGNSWRGFTVPDSENSLSYFKESIQVWPTSGKTTFNKVRNHIDDQLHNGNTNNPSNFCTTASQYTLNLDDITIEKRGSDYYLIGVGDEVKIGNELHSDLESLCTNCSKIQKPSKPQYFESFNSKNLSYQPKRKRKRASQSFT